MGVWPRAASSHLGWAVTCLCQNILTPPVSTFQHRGLQRERERDGREPTERHFYCRLATDNHKFSHLLFSEQCRINCESCILRHTHWDISGEGWLRVCEDQVSCGLCFLSVWLSSLFRDLPIYLSSFIFSSSSHSLPLYIHWRTGRVH